MRASRWETLGAWLGIWTPPRGVDVPPRPSGRKVLVGLVAVLAVTGGAAALIAPRIDESKDASDAAERREREARRLARTQRLREEQRPRRGDAPAGAARREVLSALETAITRDARARLERREMTKRVRSTRCRAAAAPGDVLFDCLGITRTIVGVDNDGRRYDAGKLGYPFRAAVDFERGRWAFCKIAPVPGEQVVPDPRYLVEMPPACRAKQ